MYFIGLGKFNSQTQILTLLLLRFKVIEFVINHAPICVKWEKSWLCRNSQLLCQKVLIVHDWCFLITLVAFISEFFLSTVKIGVQFLAVKVLIKFITNVCSLNSKVNLF